jgi:mannose/fructose/N-acetylgalactosamine-specific phosphotransferase system component IIB
MRALSEQSGRVEHVNVGGLHSQPGRVERLRYVYLTPAEAGGLQALGAAGVAVTAQDLPTAAPVSLSAMLAASAR